MISSGKLSLEFIKRQAEEEQILPTNFKQVKLTKKYLLPRLKELYDDMLRLRLQFDQEFDPANHPQKGIYPKGYCYEITKGGAKTCWSMNSDHQRQQDLRRCAISVCRGDCQKGLGQSAPRIFSERIPVRRSLCRCFQRYCNDQQAKGGNSSTWQSQIPFDF